MALFIEDGLPYLRQVHPLDGSELVGVFHEDLSRVADLRIGGSGTEEPTRCCNSSFGSGSNLGGILVAHAPLYRPRKRGSGLPLREEVVGVLARARGLDEQVEHA